MDDIKEDELLKFADVISINETHLSESDTLTPHMMNLTEYLQVFRKDRNIFGGGVALLIHQSLSPEPIIIKTGCEVVAVKISLPSEMIIISAYRPPSTPICVFTQEMSEIITLFEDMPICVMGDLNEDILLTQEKHCCTMFQSKGFTQIVTKPTQDSGTLIDHIYTNTKLSVKTDVSDCYYSDHDFVLCVTYENVQGQKLNKKTLVLCQIHIIHQSQPCLNVMVN